MRECIMQSQEKKLHTTLKPFDVLIEIGKWVYSSHIVILVLSPNRHLKREFFMNATVNPGKIKINKVA